MTSAICPACGATFNNTTYASSPTKEKKYCSLECANSVKKKHGHTTHSGQSRTYNTYMNMVGRCHRVGHAKYGSYGARGVTVCDRWRDSFSNFLEDMGERPEGMTIDRIDSSLGYFKENCRWATPKTQQANINTNVNITFRGKTQNVSAWAAELGFDKSNLAWRIRSGWPVEKAMTEPARLGNRTIKTGQVLYDFDGKTQCVSEWAREYDLSVSLLRLRLQKGWGIEKALKEPKGQFITKVHHAPAP